MHNLLNQYDDFIEALFKTVYPAIVKIDAPISISIHKYDRYNLLGNIDSYGNVHIGLSTIIKKVGNLDETIKNFILETIVHELTHLDQDIDPKIMKINKEYSNLIEAQCITQTSKFVLKNINAIEQRFNFKVKEELFKGRPIVEGYTKKSLFNAFAMKLEAAYDSAEIMRIIRRCDNIIIRYKDSIETVNKYSLKQHGELNNDVKSFNKILYNTISKNNPHRYNIHLMNGIYYIDIL